MVTANLTRFAWLSIGVAVATIALKTAAYLVTDSVALLSDALESLVNLAAALMALAMLTVAAHARLLLCLYACPAIDRCSAAVTCWNVWNKSYGRQFRMRLSLGIWSRSTIPPLGRTSDWIGRTSRSGLKMIDRPITGRRIQ